MNAPYPEDRVNPTQPITPSGFAQNAVGPSPYQQQPVTVNVNQKPQCNHTFHLLATLLTCGLWSPIWLVDFIVKASR